MTPDDFADVSSYPDLGRRVSDLPWCFRLKDSEVWHLRVPIPGKMHLRGKCGLDLLPTDLIRIERQEPTCPNCKRAVERERR